MIEKEHSEMVTSLAKDGLAIINSLTPTGMHVLHMAIGIAGEAGEVLEAIALPVDRDNVIEELGDMEFYLEGTRQGFAILRTSTITKNTTNHQHVNEFSYAKIMSRSISIESNKFLDLVKKYVIYNKDVDIEKVKATLTELEFYMEGLRQHFNITREQTLNHNINKLLKGDGKNKPRYAAGNYSDEAAQDRADKN